MLAAGDIRLDNGAIVQGYWEFYEDGLDLVTFDGSVVLRITDKEFIQLAEEYVNRPIIIDKKNYTNE